MDEKIEEKFMTALGKAQPVTRGSIDRESPLLSTEGQAVTWEVPAALGDDFRRGLLALRDDIWEKNPEQQEPTAFVYLGDEERRNNARLERVAKFQIFNHELAGVVSDYYQAAKARATSAQGVAV